MSVVSREERSGPRSGGYTMEVGIFENIFLAARRRFQPEISSLKKVNFGSFLAALTRDTRSRWPELGRTDWRRWASEATSQADQALWLPRRRAQTAYELSSTTSVSGAERAMAHRSTARRRLRTRRRAHAVPTDATSSVTRSARVQAPRPLRMDHLSSQPHAERLAGQPPPAVGHTRYSCASLGR